MKNSEKLTNVVDFDGSQLVFENNIKKGSNTETKGVDGNPDLSSTDITSTNSLSQISENVNSKFSEKIGKAEYEKGYYFNTEILSHEMREEYFI